MEAARSMPYRLQWQGHTHLQATETLAIGIWHLNSTIQYIMIGERGLGSTVEYSWRISEYASRRN
jgi:hypothetical protein